MANTSAGGSDSWRAVATTWDWITALISASLASLSLKLWLPGVFSPGVTHVEHVDLGHGWFRFTMTVMHPWFGEMFFQTGRFCATEDTP